MGRTKRGPAPAAASTNTVDNFKAWLSANKVSHPKCTIGWLNGVRGVVAQKPLKAGDLVSACCL